MGNVQSLGHRQNGVISQSEWQAGIGDRSRTSAPASAAATNADPYTTWNTDGADGLTMDEFNSGIYSGYDRDRNDIIDEPELGDLGDDNRRWRFLGRLIALHPRPSTRWMFSDVPRAVRHMPTSPLVRHIR